MTSTDYPTTQASITLEEQQSLLKFGPADETLEVQCKSARPFPGQESGLCHRLPKITADSIVVSDSCEEKGLLGDRISKSSQGSSKTHHSFSKSIEKYLSTCRFNVRFKPRRPAKSRQSATPPQEMQANLEGDHVCNISCLGQGWRGLRKKLRDLIKIEEEIFTSVRRSVLYHA